MKLPIIPIAVRCRNPNWILDANLPYEERMQDYYIIHETSAEVLTLHLQKGTMRIRYKDACGKTYTQDIKSISFFDKYDIIRK